MLGSPIGAKKRSTFCGARSSGTGPGFHFASALRLPPPRARRLTSSIAASVSMLAHYLRQVAIVEAIKRWAGVGRGGRLRGHLGQNRRGGRGADPARQASIGAPAFPSRWPPMEPARRIGLRTVALGYQRSATAIRRSWSPAVRRASVRRRTASIGATASRWATRRRSIP
jgi:hypothetical protein